MNYEDYITTKNKKGTELINFIIKSINRSGYYDCSMETTTDNYRIFHYQYKMERNAKKKLKKKKEKGAVQKPKE